MSSNTTYYPVMILTLLVFVMVVAISYLRSRGWQNAWRELASRLGLAYTPGGFLKYPSVAGTYRGRSITLDSFMRGTGKNQTRYSRVVVSVNNPTQLSMKVYQETVFSKVGKLLGGQDIQTGNEEVDQRYIIKGQPEMDVVKILTSIGLQQKLLLDRSFNFDLKGSELYFEKRGIEKNIDQIQRVFDLLCDVAEAVEYLSR